MKVGDNSIAAIRDFFYRELQPVYGEGECSSMFRLAASHLLDVSYGTKFTAGRRLTESELLLFFGLIKRLKKHEPLQYILGTAWFYDLPFEVTPAVLIPRPETEELVRLVIEDNKSRPVNYILDLCSGSGCIPVVLKKYFPEAITEAWDISAAANEVAARNAESAGVEVSFVTRDIFEGGGSLQHKVSVLTANPPYIQASEKDGLAPNVLEYEPQLALFAAGNDVLLYYRKIAEIAGQVLEKHGWVYAEMNPLYAADISRIMEQAGLKDVRTFTDMQGKERIIRATKN